MPGRTSRTIAESASATTRPASVMPSRSAAVSMDIDSPDSLDSRDSYRLSRLLSTPRLFPTPRLSRLFRLFRLSPDSPPTLSRSPHPNFQPSRHGLERD